MKKVFIGLIIIIILALCGFYIYNNYLHKDENNNLGKSITYDQLLEYGNKVEAMDLLPNTIIAKINNEPILFREIGTKRIQLDYNKDNSNNKNNDENAFYEVLIQKLYIEYAKKYPDEVEYNLNIEENVEKTKRELTQGYDSKTPEECKKEMLDLMCIKENEVWFTDEEFIQYAQSIIVDNMLTSKGISIISKFMLEKPELAKDEDLEKLVEEYQTSKETKLDLIKGNNINEIKPYMNTYSDSLDKIRELYIKDLIINSKIELCVDNNELYKRVPEIYGYKSIVDLENLEENSNNIENKISNTIQTTNDNSANNTNTSNAPSNSDLNKIYSDSINNLETDYFLKDQENYAPGSDEIKITEARAKEIAEYGFQESAKRIADEGVENKESESVKIENVSPNNYFTRQYLEGDKMYKDIIRTCYVVTRENDMGCGVSIYIDATTGLIIGGRAFGD